MDSSPHSSINDLVERHTIEEYDTFSIVTVPGSSKLAEPVRAKLLTRLQQEHFASAQEHDAGLRSTLELMTPPLDDEVEYKESREIEAKARKTMETEGCPPCYPTHLEIPLREPPEKYQAIISYWKSFPGTGDVVLRAQLSDWKRFRGFQKKVRRYYRHRNFSEFVDQVRERRRRHRLGGNVCLRLDLNQSQMETWIEFQDWHLQRLEGFEKHRDKLRKELDDVQGEVKDTGAREVAEACEQELEYAELTLKRHNTLLHWIEQERLAIDTRCSTLVKEEDHSNQDTALKAVRRASPTTLRKKQPEAPTVLGGVRVSKAKRKKPNTLRQKPKIPESEPGIEDLDIPESNTPQAPKCQESKPQRTKTETPLRQLRPQRVSKIKQLIDVNVKSPRKARQKRSSDQSRSNSRWSPQRLQYSHVDVKTRSGRLSRRPERPGFGAREKGIQARKGGGGIFPGFK